MNSYKQHYTTCISSFRVCQCALTMRIPALLVDCFSVSDGDAGGAFQSPFRAGTETGNRFGIIGEEEESSPLQRIPQL